MDKNVKLETVYVMLTGAMILVLDWLRIQYISDVRYFASILFFFVMFLLIVLSFKLKSGSKGFIILMFFFSYQAYLAFGYQGLFVSLFFSDLILIALHGKMSVFFN